MEKASVGMGMEGLAARWYAKTTRKDLEEFCRLAARIAETLPSGAAIIEVAAGPGFLSLELAKRGFQVGGLDISKTFLRLARNNAEEAGGALREMHPVFETGGRGVITDCHPAIVTRNSQAITS
jgi:2-polyprenyl-3-methyl-5-hydroxy-6-metoxy-1,4-benzoquinol methylase